MERYAWKKKCQSDISRQATNRPAACHPANHQPAIQPAAMAVPASLAAASSQQPARQQAAGKQPGASQLAACQPASSQPTSFQLGLILPIGTFFFRFYAQSPRPICESGAIVFQNRNIYTEKQRFLRIPGRPAKLMNFGVPICQNYAQKKSSKSTPSRRARAPMGDCHKLTWLV